MVRHGLGGREQLVFGNCHQGSLWPHFAIANHSLSQLVNNLRDAWSQLGPTFRPLNQVFNVFVTTYERVGAFSCACALNFCADIQNLLSVACFVFCAEALSLSHSFAAAFIAFKLSSQRPV